MNDAWAHLRRHTPARIALGRAGASMPTGELLRFSLDHAEARDAVHAELDVDRLEQDLGVSVIRLTTLATDRATYLQRPDLGRQLSPESEASLASAGTDDDLSITLADGLSATAAQRHGAALLGHLLLKLSALRLAPITVATGARVALQDAIGQALGARASLILLGERPGLNVPDSLGGYLVFNPRRGNTDANRNCVSNIRPAGLPLAVAAETLAYLIRESISRQLSGVTLKDLRPPQASVDGPDEVLRSIH